MLKPIKASILLVVLLVALIALFTVRIQAGGSLVQILEGEIHAGLTTPLGGYHSGKARVSGSLGIEGRYNFSGTPWDCGLMLDLSTARRSYDHIFNNGHDLWQSNRTLALALTGDYNLFQGAKINPFAGAALGVAFNDVVGDKFFPAKGTSFYFAPRLGVEFVHHIRLMAQFNVCRKGYNNFSLTVGFVLGGRPRK